MFDHEKWVLILNSRRLFNRPKVVFLIIGTSLSYHSKIFKQFKNSKLVYTNNTANENFKILFKLLINDCVFYVLIL